MDTAAILAERKTTHGNYDDDAACSIDLIGTVEMHVKQLLTPVQLHALHMICHKIARIVTGRADFKDHWDDIAGYATLVANRCKLDDEVLTTTFGPKEQYAAGCADDCTHPSHRHGRPGRRVDDHQNEALYKVDRMTLTQVAEPAGKMPCYCHPGLCIAEKGVPPKFVYCRKAEGEVR